MENKKEVKSNKINSFQDVFDRVPEKFYERTGFVVVCLMIGLLLVEEVYRIFFDNKKIELYIKFFYLVGGIGEIFAVFYICSRFYQKKKFNIKNVIKANIWDIFLALLLMWSTIAAFLAEDRYLAMNGTSYRFDGLMTYFVYASMYVSAKAVQNEKLRIWILRGLGTMATLLSMFTLLQINMKLLLKMGKIGENIYRYGVYSSIFYNTNHFGYYLTVAIMALVALVLIEKKMLNKLLFLCMFGFNVWALLINNTFGCYLAVMFGIIFVGIVVTIKNKNNIKPIIALVVLFVVMSLMVNNYNHELQNNFGITYGQVSTDITNDAAGSGRMALWKQAVKYIGDKPVFGYGPEGLFMHYFNDGYLNDRPHNEYLQYAAFTGIPGLIFYMSGLAAMFIYCIKRLKKLKLITLTVGGIVFAYCVSAFFGNTMYYTASYYFIVLGMLSNCHLDKEENAFS